MFWSKVELLLDRMQIKQAQLAERAGIEKNKVSGWKTKGTLPTIDDAIKVARVFGVYLDYLADDDIKAHPESFEKSLSRSKILSLTEGLNHDEVILILTTVRRLIAKHGEDEPLARLLGPKGKDIAAGAGEGADFA